MDSQELDRWLPDPEVRTHHRRTVRAGADALWDEAGRVRLRETRTLGRLVQWRIPGEPQERTFRDVLAQDPFIVLAEGERWSLSGLAGRIWTLQRDYPCLEGAQAWRDWDEPGTVRVLFGHWVEEDGEGHSTLVSEARVQATDRRGALRLRSLWLVVGAFERVIGPEALSLAARRAQHD